MDTKEIKTILTGKLLSLRENNKNKEEDLLVATYSGGDDSGNITIEIEELSSDIDFEDFLNNALGYGSWAGEFYATGEIYYDGIEFYVDGSVDYRNAEDANIDNFTLD